MTTVLVTGGSGFLGSSVVRGLAEAGLSVVSADLRVPDVGASGVEHVHRRQDDLASSRGDLLRRGVGTLDRDVGGPDRRPGVLRDPDPGDRPVADPDRFAQVLTNLVDNAVRHGEGMVCVTAGTRVVDGQSVVDVVVEDEGEGISPAIRKRVFTKFWKHGTRGGSGLGMYIIHGLVRAHGGLVEIDDAPGGGARIVIMWPAYV